MDVRLYPSAPPVGARPGAEPAGLAHLDYYHCGKVGAGGSPAGGGPRLRTESEPERPGLERGQESPGGVLSGTRAGEGGAGGAHARRHAPRRPADGHTPLTRIPLTLTPRVALITGRSHPDRHSRGDRDTHTYPGPPTASPSFTSGPAAAPTATHLLTASPSHTTRPDSHAQGHASLAHLHTRPHCRTRATRTPHTSFPARPLSHPVSHNWGRAHKEVAPTARRSPSRRLPEARTATHSRPGTVTLRHTNRPDGHSHTPSTQGQPRPRPRTAPPPPGPPHSPRRGPTSQASRRPNWAAYELSVTARRAADSELAMANPGLLPPRAVHRRPSRLGLQGGTPPSPPQTAVPTPARFPLRCPRR